MSNVQKNRKNHKFYYLILILFPFLILLLIEFILRTISFGDDYPLFVKSEAFDGYQQPNPQVIKRYFSNPELAPNIEPDTFYFKEDKPKDAFRIVIQGGSTAAGFPFGRFGSLQGMLQQRFKRIYPSKNIEIISTAMSAVNSYTLLDFTDEILAIEPDLISIYAGHNEYLGIMGVGSAYASMNDRSTSLIYLKLKNLKLFQLVQSAVTMFQSNNDNKTNKNSERDGNRKENNRTLMASVAKNKSIILNSETYKDGVDQFSGNLDLILEKYKKHNIPVLISTLASNEADQAPFKSTEGEFSADALFLKAKALAKQGKLKQARQKFIQASDRDLLRFRAPSEFNRIIRTKIDNDNIHLVDAQNRILNDSQNSIIGYQHMFEHLHPNARGYFLLAEAFVDKIISLDLIGSVESNFSTEYAWQDIPLTQADLIAAKHKIKTLVSDYPFTKHKREVSFGTPKTIVQKFALKKVQNTDWLSLNQEMLDYYQNLSETGNQDRTIHNLREAAKIAGLLFDAIPQQHKAAWLAGKLYFSFNDTKIAEYYLNQAVKLQPKNIEYLMNFAYALYVNNNKEKSNSVLKKVLAIDPKHPQALIQQRKIAREL